MKNEKLVYPDELAEVSLRDIAKATAVHAFADILSEESEMCEEEISIPKRTIRQIGDIVAAMIMDSEYYDEYCTREAYDQWFCVMDCAFDGDFNWADRAGRIMAYFYFEDKTIIDQMYKYFEKNNNETCAIANALSCETAKEAVQAIKDGVFASDINHSLEDIFEDKTGLPACEMSEKDYKFYKELTSILR